MQRRTFIKTSTLGCAGMFLARPFSYGEEISQNGAEPPADDAFRQMISELLKDWCDGMLRVQINEPGNPELHGALGCPSCDWIHGRCMDAVYPFLRMAQQTGDEKYLDAGISVFEWSKNVSMPDGSWTVIPDPTSWRGITVFGAIALAEALYYHGNLLESAMRDQWTERLGQAANYIYKTFDTAFTNINYAATGAYALNLIGEMLDKPEYLARSRVLANEVQAFFTDPHKLLFGEGRPTDRKSERGHYGVDLGYNVEESLNGLVMYALREKDEEFLALLNRSLENHLEFILPDGGWDNSWGTRQYKWTYWGSRTCDGCQPAFGLMADVNPAFGAAAYRNTRLLRQCTHDGLLYGGLHYRTHDLKPCVHHTFTHAKPLAYLLDHGSHVPVINDDAPLPRAISDGVKYFPEISVWLAARGPWRATVSSYDWIYRPGAQQASGGSLAMLWHETTGPIMTASMARYIVVESNNQQPNPDPEDIALTPRLETIRDGKWYTNLYDLTAEVDYTDDSEAILFHVTTRLQDEDRNTFDPLSSKYELTYRFDSSQVEIRAKAVNTGARNNSTALAVPIISPSGERVSQPSSDRIEIFKPGGTVVVAANVPLEIRDTERDRSFNMVPGVQAVPIQAMLPADGTGEVICTITVAK